MNLAPTPKVASSVVAGAFTTIVVAELSRRGIQLAPDEASALTVLISFVASWFTKHNQQPQPNS